jgi:transcriptional regulator with XRE-family HTH domain
MSELQMLLAENMKKQRKRLNYSQSKLAEITGLSKSYIGDIEVGKKFPSIDSIEKLGKALGMRPETLFYHETEQKRETTVQYSELMSELTATLQQEVERIIKKYMTS